MRGEGRVESRSLPSARIVSVNIFGLGEASEGRISPRPSLLLMQWGQFLDHDLVHTPEAAGNVTLHD